MAKRNEYFWNFRRKNGFDNFRNLEKKNERSISSNQANDPARRFVKSINSLFHESNDRIKFMRTTHLEIHDEIESEKGSCFFSFLLILSSDAKDSLLPSIFESSPSVSLCPSNNAKSDLSAWNFSSHFPSTNYLPNIMSSLTVQCARNIQVPEILRKLKNFQRNLEMKYKFETSQMRRESWWEWKKER